MLDGFGGTEPFQLSDSISWKIDAAIGPVHAVVFGATPLIVTEALLLYWPWMYHITCPTLTDGAVADHPVGMAAPLVGVVNVGVDADWLCTLYALIKVKPYSI